MCGIIGYTGSENVKDVLLDALELLEYRGYDSAGIAVKDENSHVTNVYKCAGRVLVCLVLVRLLCLQTRNVS